MAELPKKPKAEHYLPHSQFQEFAEAERDYYKARSAVAEKALQGVLISDNIGEASVYAFEAQCDIAASEGP